MTQRTFILGIDGGGTKTIARLKNLDTGQQWQAISGATSLTNNYNAALSTCENLIDNLCTQADCRRAEITIVLGLAGAGNKVKASEFKAYISTGFKDVRVYTDAKTSLYGANAGEPIVVVALGTGSVGATLSSDGKETQTGGWGFNVGDEGSGAKMGVLTIKAVLAEIEDTSKVQSLLSNKVIKKLGGDASKILGWSTSAKPIDFASLAPLIFACHERCALAKNILNEHVSHVEILINKTRSTLTLPVVLLGGLSLPTIPFLSLSIQNMLTEAKGDSLDGACWLAEKLVQKELTKQEFTQQELALKEITQQALTRSSTYGN